MSDAEFGRWASDVFTRHGVAFNPGSAFIKYWMSQARIGNYLGAPEGAEFTSEQGIPMQEFAGTVLYYKEGAVVKGIPFA